MRGMSQKIIKALFVPFLAFPLMGALNLLVDSARNMIMSDGGSVPVGTIISVKKGDIFYRQPLGRSRVAVPTSDISFAFLGQTIAIPKNEQLIEARMAGTTAGHLADSDALYCTAAKRTGKKRIVGMSEVSAVGMDLDAIAKLRYIQTQTCVIDVGRNRTADKAFVADTSIRDAVIPVAITPTPLERPELVRMPGESEARMVFDGAVGIIGNMSTSLQIIEEGKLLAFGNGQTLFSGGSLPRTVTNLGGVFTILSYDKKTKVGQIRIDHAFAAGEYGVKTEIKYGY
jgi:hypothetical protein